MDVNYICIKGEMRRRKRDETLYKQEKERSRSRGEHKLVVFFFFWVRKKRLNDVH